MMTTFNMSRLFNRPSYAFSFALLALTRDCFAARNVFGTSENDVEEFVNDLFAAVNVIPQDEAPTDFYGLANALVEIDPGLGEPPFNVEGAQYELERAVALIDEIPIRSAMGMHLNLIEDIVDSSSPDEVDGMLEMYKQDLINSPPEGLSSDELNGLVSDIDLEKTINKIAYGVSEYGSRRELGDGIVGLAELLGIPKWLAELIKEALIPLGLEISFDIFDDLTKCAKAWIKFIAALIKCILKPGWGCIMMIWYLRDIIKYCKNTKPPTSSPTCPPSDLCCGVRCFEPYHFCAPWNGICTYDPDADPCNPNPCDLDAICVNGDCVYM